MAVTGTEADSVWWLRTSPHILSTHPTRYSVVYKSLFINSLECIKQIEMATKPGFAIWLIFALFES